MHYNTSLKEQDRIEHFRCCLQLRKKFTRIYFAATWLFLLLVTLTIFLVNPRSNPIEVSIAMHVIPLIVVCVGDYLLLPYLIRFQRRKWYKKILSGKESVLRVQIFESYLEVCGTKGKSVIFTYMSRVKRENERGLKKEWIIGEIIEAKDGIYFAGSDPALVDKGPILFVGRNGMSEENYDKLKRMLKECFLEKYYDYSAK